MNINVTKSAGVVLKTQGKYCAEDITVVPTLEEKSVTPTESAQEIVPRDGNCGISKVNVGAVQTETKTITPTTSQQTFTPTSGKYFKQIICQAIQTETVAPSASAVEEVATAAAMDALLVEANVGKYYKFTGTTDSNYTNGDLYLVEGGAVTDELAGTWVFNDNPDLSGSGAINVNVNFTSNEHDFTNMSIIKGSGPSGAIQYDELEVCSSIIGWNNKAYKTINITSKLSEVTNGDELLAYLQANGTKQ